MFWFCIAVICQECSVLDYMAPAIQCAELSGMYANITQCSCLHVVKSARPSTPQGLCCSALLEPIYGRGGVFQAGLSEGSWGLLCISQVPE